MLLQDFFRIIDIDITDNEAFIKLELNSEHPIFQGHFPGYPITPGVCVTQMAVDLFSHIFQQEYKIHQAKSIKFINIIKPNETSICDYKLSWEKLDSQEYRLKTLVTHGDTIYAKMDFTLRNK